MEATEGVGKCKCSLLPTGNSQPQKGCIASVLKFSILTQHRMQSSFSTSKQLWFMAV